MRQLSLCATATEAALHSEKLVKEARRENSLHSPQLEKAHAQAMKTQHNQKKKKEEDMSLQLFSVPGLLLIHSICMSYVTALLGTGAALRRPALYEQVATGRPSRRRNCVSRRR